MRNMCSYERRPGVVVDMATRIDLLAFCYLYLYFILGTL